MRLMLQLYVCLCLLGLSKVLAGRENWPELVLDERVLRISTIAADLSALAYANLTVIEQWKVDEDSVTGLNTYKHPDYDEINFYNEEPDQAIIAKVEGRCYLAFRGTNTNIEDWLQNAGLGDRQVYKDNINTGNEEDRCEVRGGFADFLFSGPFVQGRSDLQICVDSCENANDCLVITGHSQGGAISTVAAITLYSLKPTVVTFGQPPSIDPGCPFIYNDRFHRYVNWIESAGAFGDVGFDLVVYAPNWISGSVHYGFNILVGEDPTSVFYGGYGDDIEFTPNNVDSSANAHTMSLINYSYQSRIHDLYDNLPDINLNGSVGGTICKSSYPELCASNSCVNNLCIPEGGVTETCLKSSCETDSDCAGDLVCIWDACAERKAEVQPGCPCGNDEDCFNQNCITNSLVSLDFVCNPDAPNIPKVDETCISGSCDTNGDCAAELVCIYGACATASGEVDPGCPCLTSNQCRNRDCITVDVLNADFMCNPEVENIAKVNETCIPESCDRDRDCLGEWVCIYGACATASGSVEAGCPCFSSNQCANKDCITAKQSSTEFECNPNKDSETDRAEFQSMWISFSLAVATSAYFLMMSGM